MLDEPSTTWLLVNTSPVEEMIWPVPAAWLEPTTVLMSTRAGSTLPATAAASRLPACDPLLGLAGTIGACGDGAWGAWVEPGAGGWALTCAVVARWSIARARLKPTPAPAAAAMIAASTTPAAIRCHRELSGDAGAGGIHWPCWAKPACGGGVRD